MRAAFDRFLMGAGAALAIGGSVVAVIVGEIVFMTWVADRHGPVFAMLSFVVLAALVVGIGCALFGGKTKPTEATYEVANE